MNDVLFSGFLNKPDNPFVLIDTGQAPASAAVGIDYFNSLGIGQQVSYTTDNNSSSTAINISKDMPNPWFNINAEPKAILQQLNDFGLVLHAGKTGVVLSAEPVINTNGIVPIYSQYPPKTPKPPHGAIVICTNPTGQSNGSNTAELWGYENGSVRVKASWSIGQMADTHMLFTSDGSVFFFFTGGSSALNPVMASLPFNSNTMVSVRELELNKIYCLRSTVSTMNGNVKNATGGPAVGFTVMAFNRNSGQVVGRTTVGANGKYNMICSAIKGNELFVVCLDDDGVAPNFEGQILDKILV